MRETGLCPYGAHDRTTERLMNSSPEPKLTDGVIVLRPLTMDDAPDHLAGEDDEMAKWLSGGHGTLATVQAYIERCQASWRSAGPLRAFGIFDCATGVLIGCIESNVQPALEPGQVNVSYGVFRPWRGQGWAGRAINLVAQYLQTTKAASQIVLRISPDNRASLQVAEKSGFTFLGVFDEPQGRRARYIRDLQNSLPAGGP